MAASSEASTQDLDKVTSILTFLEAFYRIARPPVRDIADFNTGSCCERRSFLQCRG